MAFQAKVSLVLAGLVLVLASVASAAPVPDLPPVPDVPLPPLPSVCPDPVALPPGTGIDVSVGFCDGALTVNVIVSITGPDVPLPPVPPLPGL